MLKVFACLLFITTFATVAMAQDPVKIDANHYKVEFENSQVRVLRIKVDPREKSVMHRHPNAVAVFLTDATGRFNFPKAAPQDFTRKAGDVLWTEAIVHLPENTSDQPFEVILVELKSRSTGRVAKKPGPAMNTGN